MVRFPEFSHLAFISLFPWVPYRAAQNEAGYSSKAFKPHAIAKTPHF